MSAGTDMEADRRVEEQVLSVIHEAMPNKPEGGEITHDMHFQRDLHFDSIGFLALIFRLEEALDLRFSSSAFESDIGKLRTVGDAVNFCKQLTAGKRA